MKRTSELERKRGAFEKFESGVGKIGPISGGAHGR